jgi:hypothetical protein
MFGSADEDEQRRPRGRRKPSAAVCALPTIALALGLGLLALGRAPGLAWPLIVCGAACVSILNGDWDRDRQR